MGRAPPSARWQEGARLAAGGRHVLEETGGNLVEPTIVDELKTVWMQL